RRTARWGRGGTSTIRQSQRSRTGSVARRRKFSCDGASSAAFPSSRSRRTGSESRRTHRSSTSRSPTRTWRHSMRSTARRGRIPLASASGGRRRVRTPQNGIYALGTASHAYLELDAVAGRSARDIVEAVSSLREPRTTMGGVNLVAGFRPELWRDAFPSEAPADLTGFNEQIVGVDSYTMPATQHDAVLWISGSAYDVVFDVARMAIRSLSDA